MRKKLSQLFELSSVCGLVFVAGMLVIGPALAAETTTNSKNLHRLDFRLTKASCATCILKVRNALRSTSGVVKSDIALRKPYGGVVIFYADKVNVDKMKDVAKQADPHHRVELEDILDKPISSVPTLLLPIYSTLKGSPEGTPESK